MFSCRFMGALTSFLQDLGSILTFLRICRPLDDSDFYKRMVLRPLKYGEPSGAELLKVCTMRSYEVQLRTADDFAQALMTHVCIRRTKEVRQISVVLLVIAQN